MKKLLRSVSLLLMSVVLLHMPIGYASSFDDIINLPDRDESEETTDYLEFDDFLENFQYYCKSWDASFDITNKQSRTLEDGHIILQLDGMTFWLRVSDDRHEITQLGVKIGDPKNSYKIDYSMLTKAYAMIATLEYKKPKTSTERSSILSSVIEDFQANVEPSIKGANLMGFMPVTLNNSSHSYLITFSDEDGYDLIAVIQSMSEVQENNDTETSQQEDAVEKCAVEITSLVIGDNASFTLENHQEKAITDVIIRLRYYDKDEQPILYVDEINGGSLLSLSIDGGLVKDQEGVADVSNFSPLVNANRAEIAVLAYRYEDDITFMSAESSLCWFSSDGKYENNQDSVFSNKNYFDEMFADGNNISLGITVEYIYPEHMKRAGVNHCGYGVYEVIKGSVLDKKGVEVGDVLFSCNNISWYDDPMTLERAKHELVNGEGIQLTFDRQLTTYTITITPSDIEN